MRLRTFTGGRSAALRAGVTRCCAFAGPHARKTFREIFAGLDDRAAYDAGYCFSFNLARAEADVRGLVDAQKDKDAIALADAESDHRRYAIEDDVRIPNTTGLDAAYGDDGRRQGAAAHPVADHEPHRHSDRALTPHNAVPGTVPRARSPGRASRRAARRFLFTSDRSPGLPSCTRRGPALPFRIAGQGVPRFPNFGQKLDHLREVAR